MYGTVNNLKLDFYKILALSYIQLQGIEAKTLNVIFKNTRNKVSKLS